MAGPQGGDGRHLHHSGTAARLRRHAVLPDPGACEDGQERAVTPGHRYLLAAPSLALGGPPPFLGPPPPPPLAPPPRENIPRGPPPNGRANSSKTTTAPNPHPSSFFEK